jgi:beta-glucuronidase
MGRRLFNWFAIVLFTAGVSSLALTFYLWLGNWPTRTREVVDHYRSEAEFDAHPGAPLIAHARGRAGTSLNGTWQAVIDPYARGDLGGLAARAVEASSPSDHSEFSFENGLTLGVPGDWNTQDPRLFFYQGVVWYKRTFEHAPPKDAGAGRRTFLWFGAANYRASVYLNGLLLGRHEGGFTPFNFEVTDRLRTGENLLVVRVDSELRADDVPTPLTDWQNYGGLTRDVLLLDLPARFIRDWQIALDPRDAERIRGWVQLDHAAASQAVTVRIPELELEVETVTDGAGRAALDAEARPQRWSPESPRLYDVEIEAGEDRVRERIGFRQVAVRGAEILLNGRPIFLRGISIHEEAPREGGRAHSRAHAEELLGWVKELNANFVRLAHYPHDEHMARLADELGLLVWEEIPVYWSVDFASPIAQERARRQLAELIARDRNRASVILWSIANETPNSDERQRFLAELAAFVRGEDDTRLVTAALMTSPEELGDFFLRSYVPALLGFEPDEWEYRVSDPLADVVDVQALNEYFGWYYSGALGLVGPFSSHYARSVMIENMDRLRITSHSDKPLVISELGAGARAGLRADEDALAVFSEDYQALVYRRQIDMLRQQAGVAGLSPWILKDFRSPLRLYQGVQDYWNLKGLVSDDGRKKAAFGVLRDYYRQLEKEEKDRV